MILPDFSRWGEIETAELDAVRRITAANMSTAWHTVPQVTQFDQADITAPFGGFKESGFGGKDKSLHALDKYTNVKTTWINIGRGGQAPAR